MPIRGPKDCSRSQERPRRSCTGSRTAILVLSQHKKTKPHIPKNGKFSINRKRTKRRRSTCTRQLPGRKIRSHTLVYPTSNSTRKKPGSTHTARPNHNPNPSPPKSALRNPFQFRRAFQTCSHHQTGLPQWAPISNSQRGPSPWTQTGPSA
jgi:hypothetical protein